jgi:hypothetical protein
VLTHERNRSSLQELEEFWSLDDLADFHDALDVWDELERLQAEKLKQQLHK